MRQIVRKTLSPTTMKTLWERRLEVVKAGDDAVSANGDAPGVRFKAQYNRADQLWDSKKNKAFDEIRATLLAMAPGHEHCVYCENGHASTIDHFCPKEKEPTLAFAWDNYFPSCFDCNSVYKGTQFPRHPKTGARLLVNPETDDPREHLVFSPTDGKLLGCTDKGDVTVQVLGYDRRGHLDKMRKTAWNNVQRMLVDYADARAAGDADRALAAEHDLRHQSHASLLAVLIDVMDKPGGHLVVREPRCTGILATYPVIRSWV